MPIAELNGIKLHHDTQGSGPALLFIHGLGGSGDDWEPQRAEFARDHRVITVDLRGHGRSTRATGPYSIKGFAADIAALLKRLDAAPAHVVGLSLGGAVAFQLALDAPECVRTMTIVNSGPHAVIETLQQKIFIGLRFLMLRLFPLPKLGTAIAQKLFPKPGQQALRDEFVKKFAANDKVSYRHSLKALVGWSAKSEIHRIAQPTLALTADQDYTPVSLKEEFVKRMPNAKLVVIADTHHDLPVENPPAFNRALREFLETHRA